MNEHSEHMEDKKLGLPLGEGASDSFFEVPQGFFESQKELLTDKIETETLREEAPILFSIPRIPFFQVPEKFFQKFPEKLNAQIEEKAGKEKGKKVKPLFAQRGGDLFPFQIAAAVGIFLLGVWVLLGSGGKKDSPIKVESSVLADIPTQILVEAVALNDPDTYFLVEVLEAEGVDDLPMSVFPNTWELGEDDLDFFQGIDMLQLEIDEDIFDATKELTY